jgi:hypothetical protein
MAHLPRSSLTAELIGPWGENYALNILDPLASAAVSPVRTEDLHKGQGCASVIPFKAISSIVSAVEEAAVAAAGGYPLL